MSASVTTKDTKIQSVRKARLVILIGCELLYAGVGGSQKKAPRGLGLSLVRAGCLYEMLMFPPKYTRERYRGGGWVGGLVVARAYATAISARGAGYIP